MEQLEKSQKTIKQKMEMEKIERERRIQEQLEARRKQQAN